MLRAIFITITLVALISLAPAQESVRVPCVQDKCEAINLFNKIVALRNAEDDGLKQIEQSLIHDPPGFTVALDRQANLDKLIKQADAVEALYKDAAAKAHQRAATYRRMLEIERK